MFTGRFISVLIFAAIVHVTPQTSEPLPFMLKTQQPSPAQANPQTAPRTVQISLDTDADVLIENPDGKRLGLDFKTRQFVNEISEARVVTRENSSTFILPYDKSGKLHKVSVAGKSTSAAEVNLSMTGPGFIIGVRGLRLGLGQLHTVRLSSDGFNLALTANQDGSTPQLYFTSQSGRDKPSYRFEVASPFLSKDKTISVNLDLANGRLNFQTDEAKKSSFGIMMRRTNPGGVRETYQQPNVSFGKGNNYALDFSKWDGKDACFVDQCVGCSEKQCTMLKNEYTSKN